jgi:hypothetical protein
LTHISTEPQSEMTVKANQYARDRRDVRGTTTDAGSTSTDAASSTTAFVGAASWAATTGSRTRHTTVARISSPNRTITRASPGRHVQPAPTLAPMSRGAMAPAAHAAAFASLIAAGAASP